MRDSYIEMVGHPPTWPLRVFLAVALCFAFSEVSGMGSRPQQGSQRVREDVLVRVPAIKEGYFTKATVLVLRPMPYESVYGKGLSAEGRAFLYSASGGPSSIRIDGKDNIYMMFDILPEIRKYDRNGQYITAYTWRVADGESAVWQVLVGDEDDENVYILGGVGWEEKCKRIDNQGAEKWIHFNPKYDWRDIDVEGGGLVHRGTGERISDSGGSEDRNARWRRKRSVRLTKEGNGSGIVFTLKGDGFGRSVDYRQVNPEITDGRIVHVDRRGNTYVCFSAPDPTNQIEMPRGWKKDGVKSWVVQYDSNGRYLGSFACEEAPIGPGLAFSRDGDVYQLWSDGKSRRVTRWSHR